MTQPRKVLVTGARGLLGSQVVQRLAQAYPSCLILSAERKASSTPEFADNIQCYSGDLADDSFWLGLPTDLSHIVHLAAYIPWLPAKRNSAEVMIRNLKPTTQIFQHAQRFPDLQQVVYSSSISVYRLAGQTLDESSLVNPQDLYGIAKFTGEQVLGLLEPKIAVCHLRYSSICGVDQYPDTVLPLMIARAREQGSIEIHGQGRRTQDFVYVADAAAAIQCAISNRARGIYNVGSGQATSMNVLAETISRVFTDNRTTISRKEAAPEGLSVNLNIEKARCELGYVPDFNLEQTLLAIRDGMKDRRKFSDVESLMRIRS